MNYKSKKFRYLLNTAALLCLCATPSHAQLYNHAPSEDNPIQPRVELNHRYSNDRAISMMEFWVPLGQNEEDGSVLFGDLRMMGDNQENKELNVGVGYREIINTKLLGDGIAGGMVWFDRRKTTSNSEFNQVTAGLEWLGEQYDVRLNGYVPLNKKQSYTRANPNGDGLGFVGNQIIVNTDQAVVEEALPGLDLEIGTRLNFLDGVTDSTRVYAGAYHFEGDRAEDVTGYRARIAADITSDIQVGARYQKDDVRGSQTYLEATVRFPFDAKKSFQEEGLRSRLDESPERDIDIVSNEAVLDDGIDQLVLNTNSGVTQNVLHVNNTAGGGGDGSIETPYNTLLAAQTAATTNDLIYVHRGDGTTTGQDAGVTLDDDGQMLVGSGVNLVYDTGRYRTSNGLEIGDGVIVNQQTADNPIITNGAGSGVDVMADNVLLSGLTVDGATEHGVSAINSENLVIDNITGRNNGTSQPLGHSAIKIEADGRDIENVTVINNITDNSAGRGVWVLANNGSVIEDVLIEKNTTLNNAVHGIIAEADMAGSRINNVLIQDNIAHDNNTGILAFTRNSGDIENVTMRSNISYDNGGEGLRANSRAFMGLIDMEDNHSYNNGRDGLEVRADGGTVTKAVLQNNLSENNTLTGFQILGLSSGTLTDVTLQNNMSISNGDTGIIFETQSAASLVQASIENNITNNNVTDGFAVSAIGASSMGVINVSNNSARENDLNYRTAVSAGSAISLITYSVNESYDSLVQQGFRSQVNNLGSTLNVDYLNNVSKGNASYGIYIFADDNGVIGQSNIKNNITENNQIGLYAFARNDGEISQAVYERNIVKNNTTQGVLINDDSASSTVNADFGGGAFGSIGRNNISNNGAEEILVDLDGGELKAENNFWGSAAGLVAGETLLQVGSTIDADPFLTEAP